MANRRRHGRPCAFDPERNRGACVIDAVQERVEHRHGLVSREDTTVHNDLGGLHLAAALVGADGLAHQTDRTYPWVHREGKSGGVGSFRASLAVCRLTNPGASS